MSDTLTRSLLGACILWASALFLAACASGRTKPVRGEVAGPAPGAVRRFDLVPRGYDDNGLALNPALGFAFNEECQNGGDTTRDPATCSWRFIEDASLPRVTRDPCNSRVMDPDFSTVGLTDLAITCSDSPLRYPGHVNWGVAHGGAVTYEGRLSWESYSGKLPFGDEDFNFVLALDAKRGVLAPQVDWIGLEYNSREVGGLASRWWLDFRKKAFLSEEAAGDYLGTPFAVVTGLLGIDAEHMSIRDPSIELHPVFAMALDACNGKTLEPCSGDTDRWALFVRDQGNEGMCSHFERQHVLQLFRGGHSFRLPGRKNATRVEIGERTQFCRSDAGTGAASVAVRADPTHENVLVTVMLPPGSIVDGDLYLKWTGPGVHAASLVSRERQKPRYRPKEGAEKGPREFRLSRFRANPEETAAFEAAVERSCKPVELSKTIEIGPLPSRKEPALVDGRRPRDSCSPLPPFSPDRNAQNLAAGEQRARVAPHFDLPQEIYCRSRSDKSDLAREYCEDREAGY
jgi:hypothetical protein